MPSNDWGDFDGGGSYGNDDWWYNSNDDIDSSYSTDYSGWDDSSGQTSYGNDVVTSPGYSADTSGSSSWLDKAGSFVGANWKELLAMFGGGIMGGLKPSSAPRPPSGGSGGGGGGGPTHAAALAGQSYKVVKG